jgi:UDP-N-acetylglucosamine--N-acetylmuramyl-(pentapeptide) pyrophosphoryl-undecaprenol N-acetylglucosamine transferase
MQNQTTHIVFSGGGTGGHLFPGLAVAERLAKKLPGVRITFCGSGKSFEQKHVARTGFEYFALPARPLPRGAREVMTFVVENVASYLAAGRFLREENVAAVIGTGGYASVPMARAAARHRVPLVLLEQNVIPGKATRWLAGRAALVCTSFEQTAEYLRSRCPVRWTGNPVRSVERVDDSRWPVAGDLGFLDSPSAFPHSHAMPRLLVLGGSGGARSLNENVPQALYKVRGQLSGWEIVHQSGEADFEATQTRYAKLNVPATVVPFVADIPDMLSETSLAVCRAGGTTLAELAVAGVPAIVLPYPHAADNHQAANAKYYAERGGCVTIDERDVTDRLDDEVADRLFFLLANEKTRERMSQEMLAMARPGAADDVAELVWSIVSSRAMSADLAVA